MHQEEVRVQRGEEHPLNLVRLARPASTISGAGFNALWRVVDGISHFEGGQGERKGGLAENWGRIHALWGMVSFSKIRIAETGWTSRAWWRALAAHILYPSFFLFLSFCSSLFFILIARCSVSRSGVEAVFNRALAKADVSKARCQTLQGRSGSIHELLESTEGFFLMRPCLMASLAAASHFDASHSLPPEPSESRPHGEHRGGPALLYHSRVAIDCHGSQRVLLRGQTPP